MRITQADFRTVRIAAGGLTVLLRYSLYLDGDERLPESITCRGDQVTAYFLTSTIRDSILPEENGFAIRRSWTVLQECRVAPGFCLEFPQLTGASWLLPGVARGESVPLQAEPADGALTALPGAVYLLAGKTSVLVFADPSRDQHGSVELSRLVEEEEPRVRVELRFPACLVAKTGAAAAPAAGRRSEPSFQVGGGFEQAARLNLVIASSGDLFARGIPAVLERLAAEPPAPALAAPALATPALAAPAALQARTRQEIADCRERLLVDRSEVCGLRLTPAEETLSVSAGAGLAALLPRLYPGEPEMEELALRLADFALRAQLPSGFFYERYDLRRASWLSADGRKPRAPTVLPGENANTAWALLALVGLLRRRKVPHARYLHAGSRAVNALCASAAADPGSEEAALILPEPLVELYLLTGKDAHKKILLGVRERRFADPGEPVVSDSVQPAFLRARAAAALVDGGLAVKGIESYFFSLLPWIHLNPGAEGLNRCGGLQEALGAHRLLFRGFELAHLLSRLAARLPAGTPALRPLLPHLLAFTLQQPAGTANLELGPGQAVGPVDCRVLVRELTARHRLLEEFPQFFRQLPAGRGARP
jgi:hypothetical protein